MHEKWSAYLVIRDRASSTMKKRMRKPGVSLYAEIGLARSAWAI